MFDMAHWKLVGNAADPRPANLSEFWKDFEIPLSISSEEAGSSTQRQSSIGWDLSADLDFSGNSIVGGGTSEEHAGFAQE